MKTILGFLASWILIGVVVAAPPEDARTQVRFVGPAGMQIRWHYRGDDGKVRFSEPPLEAPARYNFRQGGWYRLKLSHIPGFAGLEAYPTLEVPCPGSAAVRDHLAHNAVPLALEEADFRDILAGKQVVKTVYLPGSDGHPGAVLAVLRMGNVDLEGVGGGKK